MLPLLQGTEEQQPPQPSIKLASILPAQLSSGIAAAAAAGLPADLQQSQQEVQQLWQQVEAYVQEFEGLRSMVQHLAGSSRHPYAIDAMQLRAYGQAGGLGDIAAAPGAGEQPQLHPWKYTYCSNEVLSSYACLQAHQLHVSTHKAIAAMEHAVSLNVPQLGGTTVPGRHLPPVLHSTLYLKAYCPINGSNLEALWPSHGLCLLRHRQDMAYKAHALSLLTVLCWTQLLTTSWLCVAASAAALDVAALVEAWLFDIGSVCRYLMTLAGHTANLEQQQDNQQRGWLPVRPGGIGRCRFMSPLVATSDAASHATHLYAQLSLHRSCRDAMLGLTNTLSNQTEVTGEQQDVKGDRLQGTPVQQSAAAYGGAADWLQLLILLTAVCAHTQMLGAAVALHRCSSLCPYHYAPPCQRVVLLGPFLPLHKGSNGF